MWSFKSNSIVIIAALMICLGFTLPSRADEVPTTPEAKALLADVQAAYDKLKTLEVAGTNTLVTERPNAKASSVIAAKFTGIYAAPNKFKLDTGDEMMVKLNMKFGDGRLYGCTGTQVYGMGKGRNAHAKSTEVPAEKISDRNAIMMMQFLTWEACPPLYFAAYMNGVVRFNSGLPLEKLSVTKGANVTIDGNAYPALERKAETINQTITLVIDPESKLVRQLIDKTITTTGSTMTRTIDFTTIKPDAPVNDADFAWIAPPEK